MSAVTKAPVIHDKMAPMLQTAFSVFTQMGCGFHFSHIFPLNTLHLDKPLYYWQSLTLLNICCNLNKTFWSNYCCPNGSLAFKVIWVKQPSGSSVGPFVFDKRNREGCWASISQRSWKEKKIYNHHWSSGTTAVAVHQSFCFCFCFKQQSFL